MSSEMIARLTVEWSCEHLCVMNGANNGLAFAKLAATPVSPQNKRAKAADGGCDGHRKERNTLIVFVQIAGGSHHKR